MLSNNNPFSSEQETSERSTTATPMPDMEIITPVSSLERRKKKTKTKNPFLDDGAVVNPFINYEAPKDKIRVKSRQSVKSSSSTLFDDSNPFKVVEEQQEEVVVVKTKVAPKPPNRSSSLRQPEDLVVTLEEDLGLSLSPARENVDPGGENKMSDGNTEAAESEVELEENVKHGWLTQITPSSGCETDADSGEFQSAGERVRVSPAGLTGPADLGLADCRAESECAEQIRCQISQSETSRGQHWSDLSVSVRTEHELHLLGVRRREMESQLNSQLRMPESPSPPNGCQQLENNKRSLNGGSHSLAPSKQGKAQTLFGSLKKRFKSLQSKTKVGVMEENLTEFRAGVPRMTSTPVVKCGGLSETESPTSYGGDLPPLYRTAALRNQHQRWSFAPPLLSPSPGQPDHLHLPPGYEFYPFTFPSPSPSVSPYLISPADLYSPAMYPSNTVTSQHYMSAISSPGDYSGEWGDQLSTPDLTRQSRQTSVHTQTEQEEQEEVVTGGMVETE